MKKGRENFWQSLKKPFFALAPMANVTDFAFRTMFVRYGKPDVLWTEFVSADGLCSKGKDRLLIDLKFSKKEKPIVAQIFSSKPESIAQAVKIIEKMGFDGIDINMGCPDKAIQKQGAGAKLMTNPMLACDIIESAKKSTYLPISVKTRLGYNKIDMEWIKTLLNKKLPALTIHLRTKKEMSLVPAHWEIMKDIVRLRDEISPMTLIIGNGDVANIEEGKRKCLETGCDGAMIGRGAFGSPWLFCRDIKPNINIQDKLDILLEHTKLFEKTFKGIKNFDVMKKHFKAYINGWDGAKILRTRLMETKNSREVDKIIRQYKKENVDN
jgi:nifR3 family TIM-barrel protein